jgi:hypothetical protein
MVLTVLRQSLAAATDAIRNNRVVRAVIHCCWSTSLVISTGGNVIAVVAAATQLPAHVSVWRDAPPRPSDTRVPVDVAIRSNELYPHQPGCRQQPVFRKNLACALQRTQPCIFK